MNIKKVYEYFEKVKIFSSEIYTDNRGCFLEGYNKNVLEMNKINVDFVQENFFFSKKNVIRGIHFCKKNNSNKLLRVISGSIYEVVIDVRKDSDTLGKWVAFELDSKNMDSIYIPSGFAHGYMALEDNTIVSLLLTKKWETDDEIGIMWNDTYLSINWPINDVKVILAEKDKNNKSFLELFDLR